MFAEFPEGVEMPAVVKFSVDDVLPGAVEVKGAGLWQVVELQAVAEVLAGAVEVLEVAVVEDGRLKSVGL